MLLSEFQKELGKMDVFEQAVYSLAGVEELENGYLLHILPQNHYVSSIGNYHIVIKKDGEEIADLGHQRSNEALIIALRKFYNPVQIISLIG